MGPRFFDEGKEAHQKHKEIVGRGVPKVDVPIHFKPGKGLFGVLCEKGEVFLASWFPGAEFFQDLQGERGKFVLGKIAEGGMDHRLHLEEGCLRKKIVPIHLGRFAQDMDGVRNPADQWSFRVPESVK